MTTDLQWFLSDQCTAKRRQDRDYHKLRRVEQGAIEAAMIILDQQATRKTVSFAGEPMIIEWTGDGDGADFTRIYRAADEKKVDLWDSDDPVFDRYADDAFIALNLGEEVSLINYKYAGRWTVDGDWDYSDKED